MVAARVAPVIGEYRPRGDEAGDNDVDAKETRERIGTNEKEY